MSRFMSHREMKAASRVVGDHHTRLVLLEAVIRELLDREQLNVAIDNNGRISLVPRATEVEPELEVRVIKEAPADVD